MVNTNCLHKMNCPVCGSEGPFEISAECVALMSDDGCESARDVSWNSDSWCICQQCGYAGDADNFVISNKVG